MSPLPPAPARSLLSQSDLFKMQISSSHALHTTVQWLPFVLGIKKTPNTGHIAVRIVMNASLPPDHKPHWLVALAGPDLSTSFGPIGICHFLFMEVLPRPLTTLLLTITKLTGGHTKLFLSGKPL